MKVAIPTRNNQVDDHFGHCAYYTIYTIENQQIVATEELAAPEGCGCKSGIAAELQRQGIELMLAGNMGEGALNKLRAHGIEVIRGCSGSVQVVISGYLSGALRDSGEGCHHHGEGHQCGHHHGEGHECKHQ